MILVAPPVPEEIADDPVLAELTHEHGHVVVPESLDERVELAVALLDGVAPGLKDCTTLRELGQDLVHVLCNRVRIRTWWEGLEGSGLVRMNVHSILLHALPLLQTGTLRAGHELVLCLKQVLEPQTVLPATPDLVRGIGSRGRCTRR